MEELGSFWSNQEGIDELKQKLLYSTIELETLKVEANEEMRKHKEDVKHLLDLLKMAWNERDEATNQLQKLLDKAMASPFLPQHNPDSPLVLPVKANSSITESNSLSDTHNHRSHGSPPVDSFLDAVTSPDFSSINMTDSSCIDISSINCCLSTGLLAPSVSRIDPADSAIDNLVNGKILPEKGKLLQAVTESGPLLQTLLVSGPLPRWRNPPLPSVRIPPVTVTACNNQKPDAAENANSANYPDLSRGFSQMCSASMLNFNNGGSSSGSGNGWSLSSGGINQIPAGKRHGFF